MSVVDSGERGVATVIILDQKTGKLWEVVEQHTPGAEPSGTWIRYTAIWTTAAALMRYVRPMLVPKAMEVLGKQFCRTALPTQMPVELLSPSKFLTNDKLCDGFPP